jgi:hypothetical protein
MDLSVAAAAAVVRETTLPWARDADEESGTPVARRVVATTVAVRLMSREAGKWLMAASY